MIKSEVIQAVPPPPRTFPKLMISNYRAIVLMSAPTRGVVVTPGHSLWTVGDYVSSWDMDCFMDFEGSVILKNA